MKVLVLHGPNLNLLGTREPEIYGTTTLEDIDRAVAARASELGIEVRAMQTNLEGELVDAIQDAAGWADAIVINPGGYSHTSVAIRDAIAAVDVPAIEVHVSNPLAREPFRHTDLVGGACVGIIAGLGAAGYVLAIEAAKGLGGRGRI